MTDKELLLQAASLIPVYIDGFGAFRQTKGVFRSIGWVADTGAVLNLIVSLEGAQQANREARRALAGKPITGMSIFDTSRLHH